MRRTEEYQRKRSNPYILPENLYRQTLYQIRDTNRIKEELGKEITLNAVNAEGAPGCGGIGDPTGYMATRRAEYQRIYDAVMSAKKSIPKEYRNAVWQKVMYNTPYPKDADASTYWRWKCRFIYQVAKNLHLA